jgi:hypothetical protein
MLCSSMVCREELAGGIPQLLSYCYIIFIYIEKIYMCE